MRNIIIITTVLLVSSVAANAKIINVDDGETNITVNNSDHRPRNGNVVNLGEASYRESGISRALKSYNSTRQINIDQQNADTEKAKLAILQQEADARTAEANARIIEAKNSTEALELRRRELRLELAKINHNSGDTILN